MTDTTVVVQLISSATTLLGFIIVGYFGRQTSRDARDAKQAAQEAGTISKENSATLKAVEKNVDGKLSAIETVAAKMTGEVMRLQDPDKTTPTGIPDAENPVTLSEQGVPITDPKTDAKKE